MAGQDWCSCKRVPGRQPGLHISMPGQLGALRQRQGLRKSRNASWRLAKGKKNRRMPNWKPTGTGGGCGNKEEIVAEVWEE